ncbi:aspartate/glutamate racemase family protein [Hydrogenophaga borbori]|uniref:Aspartate/glutamate racemase family protein n=1 Tax=Hydrogenophaga borbori TaxID=2294117 RepID=A0A372EG43_9BURK|nr:amino acid racemase [Hydrogenophaga borbori]RFP77270.1 aspartate/glutamate racemase family protein [Hydrogenophaga borbori]
MNHVALIAGMGPDAGADTLARFLRACRRELQAAGRPINDQAYPHHVLVQHPIADRSAALLQGGASPVPGLVGAVGVAKAAGARTLGIACNTAHFWHGELQALFPDLEILHIADETARAVHRSGARTCAVLATAATQRGGLFRRALAAHGLDTVAQSPGDEEAVHRAIFAIKAGRPEEGGPPLRAMLEQLLDRVDSVVLGCTELGLVIDADPFAGRVVDAASELANALAAKAYGTYPTHTSPSPQPTEQP